MAKAKVNKADQAALARDPNQVISEQVAVAGAVPIIHPAEGSEEPLEIPDDAQITAGEKRREDELVYGEIIARDGQARTETVSSSGDVDGRPFTRTQEFMTGRPGWFFKILLEALQTAQEEELRIGAENVETEEALAGNMAPANKKCKDMMCDRVELRGRHLVFFRRESRYRFVPLEPPRSRF